MRFQWVVALGLAVGVGMSGCSGCVEDKSDPGSAPRDKGPTGAKSRRLIRPELAAQLADGGGGESAPAPSANAEAGK